MNKHDEIINKLLQNTEMIESLTSLLEENLNFMHMGLGMYIRNEFLWRSRTNINYFMKYYHKDNVDDISNCIIRDLISIIIKRY